jgi:DNA repair and recombination protein RAD54B
MPAFQAPVAIKRKSDHHDESSRKRLAIHPSLASHIPSGSDEYWMVLWYVLLLHAVNSSSKSQLLGAILNTRSTKRGMVMLFLWRILLGLYYMTLRGKSTFYSSQIHDAMKISTSGCDRIAVGKAEWPLHEGRTFFVSTKEIELERPLTKSEYLSGQCFGASNIATESATALNKKARLSRQFLPLTILPLTTNSPLTSNPGTPEANLKQCIPIRTVVPSTAQDYSPQNEDSGLERSSHWTANWYTISFVLMLCRSTSYRRKQQTKKHKTWDGDAYVSHLDEKLIMVSEEGKL